MDKLVERYGSVAAERVWKGMQETSYDPGPAVSERLDQLKVQPSHPTAVAAPVADWPATEAAVLATLPDMQLGG